MCHSLLNLDLEIDPANGLILTELIIIDLSYQSLKLKSLKLLYDLDYFPLIPLTKKYQLPG